MPKRPPGTLRGNQRWSTILKNHAKAIVVRDFFVTVTATFKMLYVFVVLEHATCRLLHVNVTTNPSSHWTLQQLREVVGGAQVRADLIHERDCVLSKALDNSISALGLRILRTPVASPRANCIFERVIGAIRRESLDWMISMSGKHLRATPFERVAHHNGARLHKALGSGVPDPPKDIVQMAGAESRHRFAADKRVLAKSALCVWHHEYSLVPTAARA